MEIGIDSFAAAFDESSRSISPAARLRLIEQIEHADEAGRDVIGAGEQRTSLAWMPSRPQESKFQQSCCARESIFNRRVRKRLSRRAWTRMEKYCVHCVGFATGALSTAWRS